MRFGLSDPRTDCLNAVRFAIKLKPFPEVPVKFYDKLNSVERRLHQHVILTFTLGDE